MYAPGMGRFLTRDTWGGDANRPLSFNRWGYVEGNPIIYADPSGNVTTRANGYAEGISYMSVLLGKIRDIYGTEVVYDFATLERAVFTYNGATTWNTTYLKGSDFCVNLMGNSVGTYISLIEGFDRPKSSEDNFIISQVGLQQEYSGGTQSFGGSVDIPWQSILVTFGGTASSFISDTFGISGGSYGVYAGIGNSIDILPGSTFTYHVNYTMIKNSYKKYETIYAMVDDIKVGNSSPIDALRAQLPMNIIHMVSPISMLDKIGMNFIRDWALKRSELCDYKNKTCLIYP
jgi:hypothetical protein